MSLKTRGLRRLANVAMRAAVLGGRFVLLVLLARYLRADEVGLYGLVTASVAYALYVVGLDFYAYSNREVVKLSRSNWGGPLKNQMVLIAVLYVVTAPLFLSIFWAGALPWGLAGWCFALLVTEHLAQELGRLLIVASDQMMASVLLFVRMACWIPAVLVLMQSRLEMRTLSVVLAGWLGGGVIAAMLGVVRLWMLGVRGWSAPVDWAWIGRGMRIAVPLLSSTLVLRALFTVDRYWMQSLAGIQAVGAYILFMGIANALAAFLDGGVFVFIYPDLIKSFHEGDALRFRVGMARLIRHTGMICAVFVLVAWLAIDPMLHWLHKDLFTQYRAVFPWLLAAMTIYSLGMIPHYGLYAQHRDRVLVLSHWLGAVVFCLSTWALSLAWPVFAVPVGLCAAFASIFAWKTIAYFCLTPKDFRWRLIDDCPVSPEIDDMKHQV